MLNLRFMMQKYMQVIIAISFSLLLSGCKNEKSKTEHQNNFLKVGMSADYPPFEFYQNGKIVGFEVDVINEIGKILKKDISLVDLPFDGILASLKTGKIDIGCSAISSTEERKKSVSFSKPYHVSTVVFLTTDEKLKDIQAYENKKIGVQSGSIYENFLKEKLEQNTKVQFQSLSKVPELLQNLKNKTIDGILLGQREAISIQKNFDSQGLKTFIFDVVESNNEYAIALPQNSDLVEKINQAIDELTASGKIEEIERKWFEKG